MFILFIKCYLFQLAKQNNEVSKEKTFSENWEGNWGPKYTDNFPLFTVNNVQLLTHLSEINTWVESGINLEKYYFLASMLTEWDSVPFRNVDHMLARFAILILQQFCVAGDVEGIVEIPVGSRNPEES